MRLNEYFCKDQLLVEFKGAKGKKSLSFPLFLDTPTDKLFSYILVNRTFIVKKLVSFNEGTNFCCFFVVPCANNIENLMNSN